MLGRVSVSKGLRALEALLQHPGYAPMRVQYLPSLRRFLCFLEGDFCVPPSTGNHTAPQSVATMSSLANRFFDFRILNDWNEVEAVVERIGSELSPMHLEAAFNRLKHLDKKPSRDFMLSLCERARQLAPAMSARNLSSIIHSSAKLKFIDPGTIEVLVRALLSHNHIKGLDALEMSNVLFALGSMQNTREYSGAVFQARLEGKEAPEALDPVFESQNEIVQALFEEFVSSDYASKFTESHLAAAVYGLGKLQCRDERVLELLGVELKKDERLKSFRFLELSTIWNSLGSMKCHDSSMLKPLAEEIVRPERLCGFKAHELCHIVYGTGLMRYNDSVFLDDLTREVVNQDRIVAFREQHLSSIIYALGVLDYRSDEVLKKLLVEVTKPLRLHLFTEQGISNILFAMRRLGYGSDPLLSVLMKESLNQEGRKDIPEQQLLAMLFGPGSSIHNDKMAEAMIKDIVTEEKVGKLSDEGLSGLLNGLSQIEYRDAKGTEIILDEVSRRLPTVSTQLLSYFAYGFRINKFVQQAILTPFAREVVKQERLDAFEPQHYANVFYTLCTLGWKELDTYMTLLERINSPERLSKFSEQGLANIMTGLVHIKTIVPVESMTPLLEEINQPNRLVELAEHSLMSVVAAGTKIKSIPRDLVLPSLLEMCKPGRLVRAKKGDLAQLVHSLAQCRVRHRRVYHPVLVEIMRPERVASFKRYDLALVVGGLGVLRVRDVKITNVLAKRVTEHDVLGSFRNFELANLVNGFGGMKLSEPKCIELLAREVMKPERLDQYKEQDIACFMYGFGSFSHKEERIARSLYEVIQERKSSLVFNNAHMSQIALGLANIGLFDIPNLEEFFKDALSPERIQGYRPFELAHLAFALGQLKIKENYELHATLANEIVKPARLEEMSMNEMSVISRSLAKTKYENYDFYKAISMVMVDRYCLATEEMGLEVEGGGQDQETKELMASA